MATQQGFAAGAPIALPRERRIARALERRARPGRVLGMLLLIGSAGRSPGCETGAAAAACGTAPGPRREAGVHLADLSSNVKSATGPRWVSLSGLTIELMLVI